ncbi:MAG: hypothetical protein H7203_04840 [Rhizobacter sp.]|nr:hypothetical protein [Burkholderiales bacterium]
MKSFPVRGSTSDRLEVVSAKRWYQLERVAQALLCVGETPLIQGRAERSAQRFGVHWATIYLYSTLLAAVDEK